MEDVNNNMENRIDWTIYDVYTYTEGDGVYLVETELYNGKVVTTNLPTPFVNIKHPNGEHIINRNRKDEFNKQRSMINKYVYNEDAVRCSDCNEYSPTVKTTHEGFKTIPLCKKCYYQD